MTGALVRLGRIKGIIRPAFCPILPTMDGGIVGICDSGANVEVTPAHLRQFAIMASLYMQEVYGVKNPRTALLNVGKEAEKGDDIRKETYALLQDTDCVNFVGNMESRDLLSGSYDVVVADGFSGNVLVKTTEGTALELLKKLKKDIYSRTLYKLGALLMKRMFLEEKEFMNYQNYGGSVLLGTSKVVVKGHGSSKAVAVEKCIEQAYRMEVSHLSGKIDRQDRGGRRPLRTLRRLMETMYEKVRAILAKQLRVDAAIVTLDAQIKKDLGADSLDILQLLMRLEDQYGITIPDKALATFNTVGDVVTYLEQEGTQI